MAEFSETLWYSLLGLGVDSKGRHRHKCPKCGTIWEHGDKCADSDTAHTCPKRGCDGVQRWKLLEPGKPTYRNRSCLKLATSIASDTRKKHARI